MLNDSEIYRCLPPSIIFEIKREGEREGERRKIRKFREFASSLMNDASVVLQAWLNFMILVILCTLYIHHFIVPRIRGIII